ncbi:hydroxyproline-rich glycoprotein family protein [Parasponia andersonii]|uniref:Hydroxyproline-rich glycoprotein family protein n=1 Tax=Parasponia andersonii TaxID=3476 RepID=A0A2P5AAZ8_PARAD|nr:hydroxyproline-rich glycoprotein family protein [Parasponia andersonii]
MRSANNSVDTINAAATAIVSAETRAQPTSVPKRRWGSCWSLYWCFGSHKNSKRIGHAVLVPESVLPVAAAPAAEHHQAPSTALVLPFIAPPSSPASFLQSDPPSATQSPAGLLSLTSLSINAYSSGGPASIFAIGPYAYETQLVSPPVFSTFTTEPSTAPFTPPPESVQLTTPSSPEVPFAQLLTSSLDRTRRNGGTHQKFSLTHCEFQPYQPYPGSPGGHLISPGSVVSNSGTSSPFPDRHPILGFRVGEAPRIWGFEHFTNRKWGSRLGSGSLTPDGVGLGSRLGSGSLTPDGNGLGSGTLTPNGAGLGSRLGSGCLTPDGTLVAVSTETFLLENLISEVASLVNSENGCQNDGSVVDHRVSFELTGEDVARCLANKSVSSVSRTASDSLEDTTPAACPTKKDVISIDTDNNNSSNQLCCEETSTEVSEHNCREGEDQSYQKHRSITLGSIKEFNFDNTKADVSVKPAIGSEWWANEKVAGKEPKPGNSWSFFPILQPGVS